MDKRTIKAFDELCLTPVKELTAEQIRQIHQAYITKSNVWRGRAQM